MKSVDDAKLGLAEELKGKETEFIDMLSVKDMKALISSYTADDAVVICGGDGTLNHFANDIAGLVPTINILYHPSGSGNDFARDLDPTGEKKLFRINDYITDLPTVTVKGQTFHFINGIGYGIDGYCCEVGDELRKKSDKPVNYAGIAIKGILFHYKPTTATVTVDGKTKVFKNAWLVPTMNGHYYGGGMNMAPAQDRLSKKKTVSTVAYACRGRLKALISFPSVFKGEHVNKKSIVTVMEGHEIKVSFNRPTALQIDGETITGVTEYTVKSAK